ncbi:TMEM175 family protein [Phenylobacterium sp.]|uniref:TMEM175 family protein n=1 Tax=Phenylobacterium sp. TaxID=1871053 RepID=UPI0035AD907D
MDRGRVEAFSDGVIAIIITIMVLELRPPHMADLAELRSVLPAFLAYVLSFIYLGIYWSNHHHMLHVVNTVTGPILWANLHLLFWLSLIPFATAWMGEHPLSTAPVALYGAVLFLSAMAWSILSSLLVRHEGPDSALAKAFGSDIKGKASLIAYALGIAAAFFLPLLSLALYIAVATVWLVPDRRIERVLNIS